MNFKTVLSLMLSAGTVFGMQAKTTTISDKALRRVIQNPESRMHIVNILAEPQYKSFGAYISEIATNNKGKIAIGTALFAYYLYRQLQPKKSLNYPITEDFDTFFGFVVHGLISTGKTTVDTIPSLLKKEKGLVREFFDHGASAAVAIQALAKKLS